MHQLCNNHLYDLYIGAVGLNLGAINDDYGTLHGHFIYITASYHQRNSIKLASDYILELRKQRKISP